MLVAIYQSDFMTQWCISTKNLKNCPGDIYLDMELEGYRLYPYFQTEEFMSYEFLLYT